MCESISCSCSCVVFLLLLLLLLLVANFINKSQTGIAESRWIEVGRGGRGCGGPGGRGFRDEVCQVKVFKSAKERGEEHCPLWRTIVRD